MYIRKCGYGRSRKYRRKLWLIVSICLLVLGISGFTIRVMAGQDCDKQILGEVMISDLRGAIQKQDALPGMENCVGVLEVEEADLDSDDTILVAIDPGHGGEDNGCARGGIDEKDVNYQISIALRDRLEQMGYQVLLTRDEDVALSLEERVRIANEANADIYISIHQNSCEENSVSGIETWYSVSGNHVDDSRRLAQLVHQDVLLFTEEKNRGLRTDEALYVIRESDMPSCLVETGFLSNTEDRQALTSVEYQNKIVDGIASGIDLYFNPKTMYLTFDDGPSPQNTEQILDILKEKNMKATFFVVGENVRKYPEIARRIVEEGHTIGIHCDWHDYGELYMSVDSYVADFEKAYQTVYEITGEEARLFRFPGGSINSFNKKVYQDIIEEMTNRGFVYYDWNASLEDAVSGKPSPEKLIQNAKESTLGRKKVILLAHDTVDNTVLCLEELIEQFPEYKMEPLTVEVEPIQF